MDYMLFLLIVVVISMLSCCYLANQNSYEVYYVIAISFLAAALGIGFSSAYYRILR